MFAQLARGFVTLSALSALCRAVTSPSLVSTKGRCRGLFHASVKLNLLEGEAHSKFHKEHIAGPDMRKLAQQ